MRNIVLFLSFSKTDSSFRSPLLPLRYQNNQTVKATSTVSFGNLPLARLMEGGRNVPGVAEWANVRPARFEIHFELLA